MKIGVVSDIHLEFGGCVLKNPGVDVLVMVGDILIAQDLADYQPDSAPLPDGQNRRQLRAAQYRDFLTQVSRDFPQVIYLAGNHEFYHGEWNNSLVTLRNECSHFNNIRFLERDLFNLGGVNFVGGTLWTNYRNLDPLVTYHARDWMNDYRQIKVVEGDRGTRLNTHHVFQRHVETLGYFEQVLKDRSRVVVLTHHAPSGLSSHPRYGTEDLLNWCYYSSLEEWILDRPQIVLWCHGHTHDVHDYRIGSTRVVCNPRGYVGYERGDDNVDPYLVKVVEI